MWLVAYLPSLRLATCGGRPDGVGDGLLVRAVTIVESQVLLYTGLPTARWTWYCFSHVQRYAIAYIVTELGAPSTPCSGPPASRGSRPSTATSSAPQPAAPEGQGGAPARTTSAPPPTASTASCTARCKMTSHTTHQTTCPTKGHCSKSPIKRENRLIFFFRAVGHVGGEQNSPS
ncbi:hypothetical protein J3458_015613 [Metarhizium acridum]|uniref:uncharacterized protein n=1 Tax=Metarhizium acridum TaxID=92637 RepID=UPI001C6C37AE|nr:hypothetical protein J3458_015613 [Metarhizium acridum]